tara:strand:- start:4069 stop:4578 length:510 start_codon:yes stop_codon:yes gene_type:complete
MDKKLMKNILLGVLGLVVSISSATAGDHEHDAGKISFISNGEMVIDKVTAGDISFTTGELTGLGNVGTSSYAALSQGTVLTVDCTVSALDKDGQSNLYALCSIKDKDGDEFSMENTAVRALGSSGSGKGVLRGVSGKYAEMMGNCVYDTTYMMNDGIFVSVSFDCDMKH